MADAETPPAAAASPAQLPAIIPHPARTDWVMRGLGFAGLLCGAAALVLAFAALRMPAASPDDLRRVEGRQKDQAQALDTVKQALASLSARLDALAAVPQGSAGGASHDELADVRAELDDLRRNVGGAKDSHDTLLQLKSDLAAANAAIAAMHGHVQKATDTAHHAAVTETATRAQLIAYMQLREKAATASPFTAELKALAAAAQDTPQLKEAFAKLENMAAAGIATLPMLQARFNVMSGPALQVLELAAANNWWDRMAAHLREVVMIRKLNDDAAGPGAARRVHDASAALQRGDIPGAIAQVEAMPPAAQDHLREWLGDARARVALEEALARIGATIGQEAAGEARNKEQGVP